MQYLVRYGTPDGIDRYEDFASVDGAVALVERLRNEQDVSEVRLYRQLPLEIRTYYKVVVHDDEREQHHREQHHDVPADGVADAPPGAMPLSARPVVPPVGDAADETAESGDSEEGNRKLFTRG